jgi:cyclopropane fatty-acyl-phospholipid synthase-like methyltransferase
MSTEREHVEKIQSLFDVWAENGRAEGMELGHTPMAKPAFLRLGLRSGQRYLDIGCGNGYSVRWAAENPEIDAIGLDVSDAMVTRARRLSEHLPNTRFIRSTFPLAILKPETFDAIFSMEVFYYLQNLPKALKSTLSLLKPGGLFACIVDFYEENSASHGWSDDIGINLNLLSKANWRTAMENAGFQVIEQTQLTAEVAAGEVPDWRHTQGSLLTLCRRPQAI